MFVRGIRIDSRRFAIFDKPLVPSFPVRLRNDDAQFRSIWLEPRASRIPAEIVFMLLTELMKLDQRRYNVGISSETIKLLLQLRTVGSDFAAAYSAWYVSRIDDWDWMRSSTTNMIRRNVGLWYDVMKPAVAIDTVNTTIRRLDQMCIWHTHYTPHTIAAKLVLPTIDPMRIFDDEIMMRHIEAWSGITRENVFAQGVTDVDNIRQKWRKSIVRGVIAMRMHIKK